MWNRMPQDEEVELSRVALLDSKRETKGRGYQVALTTQKDLASPEQRLFVRNGQNMTGQVRPEMLDVDG